MKVEPDAKSEIGLKAEYGLKQELNLKADAASPSRDSTGMTSPVSSDQNTTLSPVTSAENMSDRKPDSLVTSLSAAYDSVTSSSSSLQAHYNNNNHVTSALASLNLASSAAHLASSYGLPTPESSPGSQATPPYSTTTHEHLYPTAAADAMLYKPLFSHSAAAAAHSAEMNYYIPSLTSALESTTTVM